MKKLMFLISLVLIASFTLAACGPSAAAGLDTQDRSKSLGARGERGRNGSVEELLNLGHELGAEKANSKCNQVGRIQKSGGAIRHRYLDHVSDIVSRADLLTR